MSLKSESPSQKDDPNRARKRGCINPCQVNGGSGLSRFGGTRYKIDGNFERSSGCECAKPWLVLELLDGTRTRYEQGKKTSSHPGEIRPIRNPGEKTADDTLLLIPCRETFRYPDSEGTKLHRALMAKKGIKTTFNGCQGFIEKLVDDDLTSIRTSRFEVHSIDASGEKDLFASQEEEDEELQELGEEDFQETQETENHDEAQSLSSISLRTETPALPSAEDTLLAEEEKRELRVKFKDFWKDLKLTFKQKSAIEHLYLENPDGLTHPEVAAKLRIDEYSLRDRVKQVRKKLEKRFTEFESFSPKQSRAGSKGIHLAPDTQFDGFFRRSTASEVSPIYRIDVKTGRSEKIELLKTNTSLRTPHSGIESKKEFDQVTSYFPRNNGTWSPWLPLGADQKRYKKNQRFETELSPSKARFLQANSRLLDSDDLEDR